jgi:hypothetical protein
VQQQGCRRARDRASHRETGKDMRLPVGQAARNSVTHAAEEEAAAELAACEREAAIKQDEVSE